MLPQQVLWSHLDDFVLVDDEEMMLAVRLYLELAKTLAEPAGAAPLAAALRLRPHLQGMQVALILSGGNISPEEVLLCLQQTAAVAPAVQPGLER
jgi:threonine dehydratase